VKETDMDSSVEDLRQVSVVGLREHVSGLAESLEQLTLTAQVALRASDSFHDPRVARALASAANLGASLDELADASGMAPARVAARLWSRPELLDPGSETRLRLSAVDDRREPAATKPQPGLPHRIRHPRRLPDRVRAWRRWLFGSL
jgi:hypothetical protein